MSNLRGFATICRVLPQSFEEMFGVIPEEFNEFAIACCREQIDGVYGDESPEKERFNQGVAQESK